MSPPLEPPDYDHAWKVMDALVGVDQVMLDYALRHADRDGTTVLNGRQRTW